MLTHLLLSLVVLAAGVVVAIEAIRLEGGAPRPFVAPVVRMDALKEHPAVASALNQISEMLDDPQMSELNWRVDGNKEEAKDVARDFLKKKGLVK